MNIKQIPLVSVVMITYGHENFIDQAINGVLMQECDFEVELIIANDCSPDTTDEVIRKIIKNHPKASWIKYLKHEKNIGMMPNFIFALKEAQGKYIALCEGDDYWTDPLKLQKQVDFLEKNEDYSFCFHNSNVIDSNSGKVKFNLRRHFGNKTFSTSTVIQGGGSFSATSSMVFRKQIVIKIPAWFHDAPVGDLYMNILCAMEGKVYNIDDNMSVYRNNDSNWSAAMENDYLKRFRLHLKNIELLKKWDNESNYCFQKPLKNLINETIRYILLDKDVNKFDYDTRKGLYNELPFINKIEVKLLKSVPIIPKLIAKTSNVLRFFF